jgi:hypothetical protein
LANANLCMSNIACTYVSGLNERYVMHTYVSSLCTRAKLTTTERETERERDRDRQTTIKHRGLYHTFFLLNKAAWKKQDLSFQSSVWVQIKNIVFNFDIVLKSVVGMQ